MSHVYICPSSFLSKWDTLLAIPNVALSSAFSKRWGHDAAMAYLPIFLQWTECLTSWDSCFEAQVPVFHSLAQGCSPGLWVLGVKPSRIILAAALVAFLLLWQTSWRSSLGGWNYWLTILEHSALLWGRQGRDSSNSSTVKGWETRGTYSCWFFIEIELYHFPSPFPPSSSPSWASLNPTPSLHSQVDSLFFFDYHCEYVYMHVYAKYI